MLDDLPRRVTRYTVVADHPAPACTPVYYFEVEFLAIPDNVTIFLGYLNVNHTAGRLFDSRSWAFSKNEDGTKSRLVEYNDGFRQNLDELNEHF